MCPLQIFILFFAKQEDIVINHNLQHPSSKPGAPREGGISITKGKNL
jgi:hypothetical protein